MEYEEIDLRQLLDVIRKRFLLIVLIVLISVITASILSFFVLDKEYEASTSLIIGNSKDYRSENSLEYSEVLMYQKLIKTFGEIAKSRMVSEEVIDTLKLNYSVANLQNRISIEPVGDTQMINIKVRDNDPKLAASIANQLARMFKNKVGAIMKVDNIEVIDTARVPVAPVKPKPLLNIAITFILSLMIGIGLCFLLEFLDQTVKTPSDVEKYLELPVIGAIPDTTHVN
ncbi:MAG: Wzz/FepE/Etk N-terminal domain-containing protein [Clostridia bacterium]|nr:Wzz/FepE/Etk N-terminal domain-containing protein [Clostridia bacterium]